MRSDTTTRDATARDNAADRYAMTGSTTMTRNDSAIPANTATVTPTPSAREAVSAAWRAPQCAAASVPMAPPETTTWPSSASRSARREAVRRP